MLLDLLREIEDQNTKLGWCLEHGDAAQALVHQSTIRGLVIEAAVLVLRRDRGQSGSSAIDFPRPAR